MRDENERTTAILGGARRKRDGRSSAGAREGLASTPLEVQEAKRAVTRRTVSQDARRIAVEVGPAVKTKSAPFRRDGRVGAAAAPPSLRLSWAGAVCVDPHTAAPRDAAVTVNATGPAKASQTPSARSSPRPAYEPTPDIGKATPAFDEPR